MKPVILSFFAIILCYSLFFNEKKEKAPVVRSSANNEASIILPESVTNYDSTAFFGSKKYDVTPNFYISPKKSL
jgi:hypothetical protein